ncbi:cell surface glycoprotein CD200 receptor 1-A-like [Mauremys reevesii]|uniref:cell surface glycoprotein CD200 receptor 1-A-like n=1 Tax=Mauremys reevesii TaxID=260615 RepID=UPI0019401DB2|nr:cell surface glycoprotein CD200 receptor 1-A-like [Mauremys reevesii]
MKAKADMNCVGKTFCAFILLTIAVAMVPMDNIRVSKIAGSSVNLTCGDISRADLVSIVWKIRPRTGNHCALAYRMDLNKTDRTNCSERMDWKSSPETDSALWIRQVTLTEEGCYICETATSGGNLHRTYTLTVLVPPEVTLTCDSNGTAVCKAAAGKPGAQVSWDPNGDPRTELENHTDGTVTVLSMYSSKETSITCLVSHPAWNTTQSKECPSDMFLQCFAICAGLLGIFFILVFIFFCKLHCGSIYQTDVTHLWRTEHDCPTAPTHNVQDSNEQQELEPYASYVQKENVIYNTVYEVTVSEDLPPGLQSAT